MSGLVLTLALAAGLHLVAWIVVDQVTVASLRRAARRGLVDRSEGEEVRDLRVSGFGANSTLEARYLPYSVGPGEVVVVHGRAHAGCTYLSVVLYDRLLQSVPPRGGGPTWVAEPPIDEEGHFSLVLAHEDPGLPGWLDVSQVPEGVLFERHAGPVVEARSRLERL